MDTVIKSYIKKGKDAVLNTPEIERKVRDATSNDKWGPSGTQMSEISRASYNYECFPIIMGVIWKRINDPGKFWRHVYKSLLLIDYLVRNGSPQVIRDCRHHTMEIKTLVEFQYIEEEKDVGLSVRERAKQVIDLLQDDQRIKEERDKAKGNQNKYVGIGNDSGRDFGYSNPYGGSGGHRESYDSDPYNSNSHRESYGGNNSSSNNNSRESYSNNRRNSFGNERDNNYNSNNNNGNNNSSYDSDPYSNTRAEYENYSNRAAERRNNEYEEHNNNNTSSRGNNNNNNNNSNSSSNNNNNNNNTNGRPRAASGGNLGPAPVTPNFQSTQQPTLIDFSEPSPVNKPIVFDPLMDLGNNNVGNNNNNNGGFGGFQNGNVNNNVGFNFNQQQSQPQQQQNGNNFLQLTSQQQQQQQQPNNNNFNNFGQPQQQAQQFGQFQNSAMQQNKDPFAKTDEFGDFSAPNGSADFNPFEQANSDFSASGNSGQQKPKDTNDPWSKKDLFDLSNLGNQSQSPTTNQNNNQHNNTRSQPARVANGPITSAGSTIPTMRPMNQQVVGMNQGMNQGMGMNQGGFNQGVGMNQGMGMNQGGFNQGVGMNQMNQGGFNQGVGMNQMNQGGMGMNQGGFNQMNQGGFNQGAMNNNMMGVNNMNRQPTTGSMGSNNANRFF